MKHTGLGKTPKHYLLYIEKGEKINEQIELFCQGHGIVHASYQGIGAIKNIEVGLYDLKDNAYKNKTFTNGGYELTSLVGNFGFVKNNNAEDKWFAHTHITFTDDDYSAFGGHLFEAEVAAVAEIYLTAYSKPLNRSFNEDIGLNTMDIACKHGADGKCDCGCDDSFTPAKA